VGRQKAILAVLLLKVGRLRPSHGDRLKDKTAMKTSLFFLYLSDVKTKDSKLLKD